MTLRLVTPYPKPSLPVGVFILLFIFDTKMKGIPLVITYHPLLNDFASVIRKHIYILYLSKEVKEIFTPHSEGQENWEAILLGLIVPHITASWIV